MGKPLPQVWGRDWPEKLYCLEPYREREIRKQYEENYERTFNQ